MAEPLISAIICTHNREQYLPAALTSLQHQDFGPAEIIVVDNASTDGTANLVKQFADGSALPIQYLYEPRLGLSIARNTGAQAARGKILAYLDDDAEAGSHWLQTFYQVFEQYPQVAIAGGRVTLKWPQSFAVPPAWLSTDLASTLGAYDLGDTPQWIDNPQLTPRGLNYAIRKDFLLDVGGFNTQLGRMGQNLLSNEELHMTQLALTHGWQVLYVPAALAAHHVAPARLHPQWFLSRSWWQGISESYREQIAGHTGSGQLTRGGERLLRGLYKSIKYCRDPAQRFENFAYAYGQIGYLVSVLRHLAAPRARARPTVETRA
jgi:cellulose synthase/poly-beta-1,6-N-acetylglucosamine synthase-like glycosyltransferase